MQRTQREGMMYVFLAVLGYSFLPTLSKWILASGLEPIDIAMWRFIFAAPAFWLIIFARRLPLPARPLPRLRLLAMGSLLAGAALAVFFGLQYLPASTYIVLFYTYPAIVALLSVFLGERLPAVGWIALGMTLVGITLTAPDFSEGLTGGSFTGVLLALFNAVIVAVYFLINSRLLRGHTALARASAWTVTGALAVILFVSLLCQMTVPADPQIWVLILILALLCTVMPVFALTNGIQRLGPARASILGTVEPVLTAFWAMLMLGEHMEPIQALGAAFILGSVVLLQLHSIRPAPLKAGAAVSGD